MSFPRIRRAALIASGLAVMAQLLALPSGRASDHIDSPTITQDRGADIADNYAFVDPNDNTQVILMMSTQGFIVSGEHFGMAIFDSNLRYRFEIENTGDAKPDAFVDVTYSKGLGRTMTQTATIEMPGGKRFTAPTTSSDQEYKAPDFVITTDSGTGALFYGGVADDPFFLDDTGANRLVASSLMKPGNPDKKLLGERGGRDTYAGFNTLITAVRLPAAMLKGEAGDMIGVNAVTQRRQTQQLGAGGVITGSGDWVTVDRDGNPLVNNGLIPATRKDEYNTASTEDDANGVFQADLVKSLKGLGTDDAHIAMLAKVAVAKGDILRLDLMVPNMGRGGGNNGNGGFGQMGGRRLQDDVVDMTFTIINNGVPLTDEVHANDKRFGDTFPFVAEPYQPFRRNSGTDDGTRQ